MFKIEPIEKKFKNHSVIVNIVEFKKNKTESFYKIPRGLVVRIWRSHRQGPGSIPGTGKFFAFS